MEFLDRLEEKKRLSDFITSPESGFACIYGRRRIGKSRLLREVTKDCPYVLYYIADKSEAILQRSRLADDISCLLPGFNAVVYNDWGSILERWIKDSPAGSCLIIDEFPYLVMNSPELPSVMQRCIDTLPLEKHLKIIICGSSQRMMQGFVLSHNEPLYGRAREILCLSPLGFPWMKQAFPGMSYLERVIHYSVWGGVPRYWELSENETTFIDSLRKHVFSPLGILHSEVDYLLLDDIPNSVQAISILSLIGQGCCRLSELASRLQCPATALPGQLKRLIELGMIARKIPFGSNPKNNKFSYYEICDPFISFWYRFVLPNLSDEMFLSDSQDIARFQSMFHPYLGKRWEAIVQDLLSAGPAFGFAHRWKNCANWWGHGLDHKHMEIDIVAESPDEETLLIGEAKISVPVEQRTVLEYALKQKAENLPLAKSYRRIITRLFIAEDEE